MDGWITDNVQSSHVCFLAAPLREPKYTQGRDGMMEIKQNKQKKITTKSIVYVHNYVLYPQNAKEYFFFEDNSKWD